MWVLPTQAAISMVLICGVVHDDYPRHMGHYQSQYPRGLNSNVPRQVLQQTHVERWARILNASEAQHQFMMIMFRHFIHENNEYLDREAPRYLTLGAELAELHDNLGPHSPEFLALAEARDKASHRVRQDLISIEHRFVASFEPVLTKEQLPQTEILRLEAIRRGCRTFFSTARWVGIELREIWEESVVDYAASEEQDHVEIILAQHERQLTPLICQRSDMVFEVRRELTARNLAREAGTISHEDALVRLRQIMDRRLDVSTRIRLQNEGTVDRIVRAVSDEVAAIFVAAVRGAVFPELYPDRTSLHQLFRALTDDAELNEDTVFRAASLFAEYARQHEAISRQLESICIERGDKTEAGISGHEPQYLSQVIEPLLMEREQLSIDWFDHLIDQFGDNIIARAAPKIPAKLRSRLDDVKYDDNRVR